MALAPDGALSFELPLESRAADFALVEDNVYATVPGRATLADLYVEGSDAKGLGPVLGESFQCPLCMIYALPSGRLVVADPRTPQLFLFGHDLKDWTVIDLDNEVIADWRSAQGNVKSGSRVASMERNWIAQVVRVTEDEVVLLMFGRHPGPKGTELWLVDLRTGAIVRQFLAGEYVVSAVQVDDDIYALLGEFTSVAVGSGEVLGESSPAILRLALP